MCGWSLAWSLLHSTVKPAACGLKPAVVEADADAIGGDAVRHDLMPEPAFEHPNLSCGGRKCSPRPRFAFRRRFARRRRHESIQPRILELDPRRSRRDVHIVS